MIKNFLKKRIFNQDLNLFYPSCAKINVFIFFIKEILSEIPIKFYKPKRLYLVYLFSFYVFCI
ncbi:hypothetical protein CV658_05815 [Borreliella burgdorferi]|uniref:Uncharacterized protein n=1 Tax=Borreliella burgdorferi 297 TaxID=521009 RepID=A0A9N7BDT6_BORBG|nr:hypothetical protein BbuJD1_F11 [Borreliella burgdorferi JD1]ADQ44743.1 hypothetical protein Bbu297_F16 [Borreliella burgdorferi 297]PRQ93367.1 hypothetical protein CV682_05710 [Borreliella burgdorferi]PRR01212.1 hypothetical protein CV665_05825 [Borreliella burgdorferi]PRR06928.1 hypothetical protein CV675_05810 [Borreliella burgdorferi]